MKTYDKRRFAARTAVTLAAVAVVASGSPDLAVAGTENTASSILPKTVFSSKLRMVFAVGLEGTGHDYILQVDDDLFENNEELVRLTADETVNVGIYHVQYSMGKNVKHYSDIIGWGRAEMRRLAERAAELPSPGTVMIVHGKYSYPDGFGLNKVMMYLDLRLLAEAAEAEGVDFRVVYLRRPVKDILVADTVHRNFQDALGDTGAMNPELRYMEYMQVLITDIAVMHSFLAELDPAFVVCHDFDRAGDLDQASSIANFLAPNADVAELLKTSFVAVARAHEASTETLPYEGADVVSARLQRKFDAFESALCTGTR